MRNSKLVNLNVKLKSPVITDNGLVSQTQLPSISHSARQAGRDLKRVSRGAVSYVSEFRIVEVT